MANAEPNSTEFQAESTFRAYTQGQGLSYAQNRLGYEPEFLQFIIDHHTSTGGQLDTIVDVGCGPGTAVRALAPYFAHAIGLDQSEGMISTARSLGGSTSSPSSSAVPEPINFQVSTAEDLGSQLSPPLIADNSVDLLTAAAAAHWFDMSRFWPRAAQVLKPGGSVALWVRARIRVSASVPNSAAIQTVIDAFEEEHLMPYMAPGNLSVNKHYADLELPWSLSTTPAGRVAEFDEASLLHKVWDGSDGDYDVDGKSLVKPVTVDMDTLEKMMGTASPVTRWRTAHPDAVGTERDVVRVFRRDIERLLHEAGVEKGKEVVEGTQTGTLLIVKKKL
ncbi:methyltransferase [Histoplasma ohiense]|nr:methyltransferase [Histoplasma ohiense (nom. inval.)]